jgi:hypothetical protein
VLPFGVIGYFMIPAAVRWGVQTACELGREVRVESVSANPYTSPSPCAAWSSAAPRANRAVADDPRNRGERLVATCCVSRRSSTA